jgi:hypothetical protein
MMQPMCITGGHRARRGKMCITGGLCARPRKMSITGGLCARRRNMCMTHRLRPGRARRMSIEQRGPGRAGSAVAELHPAQGIGETDRARIVALGGLGQDVERLAAERSSQ